MSEGIASCNSQCVFQQLSQGIGARVEPRDTQQSFVNSGLFVSHLPEPFAVTVRVYVLVC